MPRFAWHHVPVTGSTLYRRLPNGSWAAEREDARTADGVVGTAAVVAGAEQASAPPPGAVPAGPAPAGPAPAGVRPPPTKRRRRWGPLRILRWAVAAYVVWLIFLVGYAAFAMNKIDALSPDPIEQTDGTVWLMVGSDSREGLTKKEQRELRTGNTEGQRTDTIMLVHQQLGQAPKLVSIPRDSWVTIPAHTGSDGTAVPDRGGKINSAFAFGGAPLLSQTIEYNTGLHVDHYMEVGFGGIVDLTDAVGGIEACFDEAITDENSGLDVQAGCQTLEGAQALAWVRMRYADPKGDLGRIERQQQYMAAMVDEMLSVQTLLNPVRQWGIVNAAVGALTVDTRTGLFDLGRFGVGAGRIAAGNGEVTTVPIDDTDHWESGQWVIKWDQAQAGALFGSMGAGTAPASLATSG